MKVDINCSGAEFGKHLICLFCGAVSTFGRYKCGCQLIFGKNSGGFYDSSLHSLEVVTPCPISSTILPQFKCINPCGLQDLSEDQLAYKTLKNIVKEDKLCSCDMTMLMRYGCKCGGK